MGIASWKSLRLAWACGAFLLLGGVSARAQGVHVALTPSASEVSPGAVFDLELTLTQAGGAINGFDAVIGFDPAALTFIPLAPTTLQQGALMTGACGNMFHRFTQEPGKLTIADVMLCAGVSVTGPGQVYRLRFLASNTPQITYVTFLPGLQFYNAGLFVNPAVSTDAVIGIGTSLDAGSGPRGRFSLEVKPNPARAGTSFVIELDRPAPVRVRVLDVRGRSIRRFEDTAAVAGSRTLRWDGLDAAGRRVPAGMYIVMLEADGRTLTRRLSLVR
jgi:hypothetical protein